jgi:hypothetical protein
MPAAAAVAFKEQIKQKAAAGLVVAAPEHERLPQKMQLQEPQILVEAAAAVVKQVKTAQQAAPASSSSSTTSALPQSSPSSHRRSGLHLRVR